MSIYGETMETGERRRIPMVEEWILHNAADTAEELIAVHTGDGGDGESCGYGFKARVLEAVRLLRTAMFPEIYAAEQVPRVSLPTFVSECLQKAALLLRRLAEEAFGYPDPCGATDEEMRRADEAVCIFMSSLPEIMRIIGTDVEAAYLGDPAARNRSEIMLAYPSFEAISVYRLANRLFRLGVPLIPRVMTEYAHQRTGIDIHPGASIGESFFIDHGTGVVIGETCTIGSHVKLYQGVTLGAKSFETDENGNPVKGIKRHPDIGNHVVIYAGATILGGDTRIGDRSVIGGNVWLTRSVPADSVVYNNLSGKIER